MISAGRKPVFFRAFLSCWVVCALWLAFGPHIAAGETTALPPSVVAIGDSITWGYGAADPATESWPAALAASGAAAVVNAGIDGQTTAQMRQRFVSDVVSLSPDAVIILGGINDSLFETATQVTKDNLAWMVAEASSHGIRPILGTLTPTGSRSQWVASVNHWIRDFAMRTQGVSMVDFYKTLESPAGSGTSPYLFDWEHPTTAGYALMAAAAQRAIEDTCAPSAVGHRWDTLGTLRLRVSAPGVLSGSSDADGDALSAELLDPVEHGSLALMPDGSFDYSAREGFAGLDTFTLVAFDGTRHSDPQTVTVGVWGVPTMTLDASAAAPSYGGLVRLVAHSVDSGGEPISGAVVSFERWIGSRWSCVATATTDASGRAAAYVGPLTTRQGFRVRFLQSFPFRASASPSLFLKPKACLTKPVAPAVVPLGGRRTVFGYLRPRHNAGSYPVRIYKYRYVSGTWKSYGYVNAKAYDFYSYTKCVASVRLPYAGKWRLRAYHADSGHAATWSSGYDYVTVR